MSHMEELERRVYELEDALWEVKKEHFMMYTNTMGRHCPQCTRAEGTHVAFPCEPYKKIEDVLGGY